MRAHAAQTRPWIEHWRDITFMYVTWTLATVAVAGYRLATAVWQLMLASLAFNALETAGTIVWATAKERHVPAELLGQVSSLDWPISIDLLPLSFALTGPVSGAIGAQATLIGAGVLGGGVTFAALLAPGCATSRRRGRLSSTDGRAEDERRRANSPSRGDFSTTEVPKSPRDARRRPTATPEDDGPRPRRRQPPHLQSPEPWRRKHTAADRLRDRDLGLDPRPAPARAVDVQAPVQRLDAVGEPVQA
jgi:hypothetical protein